jgi:hypothetical protein
MLREVFILASSYNDGSFSRNPQVPLEKVKSSPGRKPGYRMKTWQKEVQLASLRNQELKKFNIFLEKFVHICAEMEGERFYMEKEREDNTDLFVIDNTYILESVYGRNQPFPGGVIFFFRHENCCWKKECIKTHEMYSLVMGSRLFPSGEGKRRRFCHEVVRIAKECGLEVNDGLEEVLQVQGSSNITETVPRNRKNIDSI